MMVSDKCACHFNLFTHAKWNSVIWDNYVLIYLSPGGLGKGQCERKKKNHLRDIVEPAIYLPQKWKIGM